ncbi:MAG: hypothetical protein CMJ86_09145 [Planctomycetes bacterium]|nr:hypothetical protein [Planctomycetota bacterium]
MTVHPALMTLRPALVTLPLALYCLGTPPVQDPDSLAALERTIAAQTKTIAASEARLTRLEKYLSAQAAAESAFVEATQAARKAGFVAGINPASREILISAWAARATARNTGLPTALPKASTRD